MTEQLSLIPLTPVGAHRKRDPQTSVEAAASMSGDVLNEQQRLVLTRLSWVIDANAYELTGSIMSSGRGIQQSVVARRLCDLEAMGLAKRNGIKRPGMSKRLGSCWCVTRRGLQWLEGVVDVRTDLV